MSKIIDGLQPEDFGRSFDTEVFEKWKQSLNAQAQAFITILALQAGGLIILMILGGFVGLGIFFAMMIGAMIISLSKRKVTKEYQKQLGITNEEYRQSLAIRRKKMKEAK